MLRRRTRNGSRRLVLGALAGGAAAAVLVLASAVAAIAAIAANAAVAGAADAQEGPTVSAGGPYSLETDEFVVLQGEISGFPGDVEIAWTLDGEHPQCSLTNPILLTPQLVCDVVGDVGVTLSVTDLTTGDELTDSTVVHFLEPTPGALVVDAGGPYTGVVGEPIALHGTVTGAEGDVRVIWSEDAEGIPCTFGNATSLDATVTCHEPFQVGIVLQVEDLATGEVATDVALIHADAAPPTTPTTGRPPTAPPSTAGSSPHGSTRTPGAGQGDSQLPRTGASSAELAAVGLGLLAGGTAALLAARRSRRQDQDGTAVP